MITALVGSKKGDSGTNIKTALDSMKSTLRGAITGFMRKLEAKFRSIQLWSAALTCPPPFGKCPPTGVSPPVASLSARSLIHQNGTEEEYKEALAWFNETIADSDLTEEEKVVKGFVMSKPDILSRLLTPIYEGEIADKKNNKTSQDEHLENLQEDIVHILDKGIDSKNL